MKAQVLANPRLCNDLVKTAIADKGGVTAATGKSLLR